VALGGLVKIVAKLGRIWHVSQAEVIKSCLNPPFSSFFVAFFGS
jgi:hypothetical protein